MVNFISGSSGCCRHLKSITYFLFDGWGIKGFEDKPPVERLRESRSDLKTFSNSVSFAVGKLSGSLTRPNSRFRIRIGG